MSESSTMPPRYYGCSGEHVGFYQYAVRQDGGEADAPPILCTSQDLAVRIPTLLNGWSTGDLKILADLAVDNGGIDRLVNLVEIGKQRLRYVQQHYAGLDDAHLPHTPDGSAWYDAIPSLDTPIEQLGDAIERHRCPCRQDTPPDPMADTIDGHPIVDERA